MYPNFARFLQEIWFKSALESFASVRGHLRTALTTDSDNSNFEDNSN